MARERRSDEDARRHILHHHEPATGSLSLLVLTGKKIDYINTHGTSTPVGDAMELKAVKARFAEEGYSPYIGSTKSLTGHALGAAGVFEAIFSLLMVNKGFLAESANLNNVVEEAEGLKMLTSRFDGDVSESCRTRSASAARTAASSSTSTSRRRLRYVRMAYV